MINNIVNNKPLPIYGKGDNIRDWLWVEDHANAIVEIFHKGKVGEAYNIGGLNEWTNLELVKYLCNLMDRKLGRSVGESEKLITYVTDRAGHDMRYAIDASKLASELGITASLEAAHANNEQENNGSNNDSYNESVAAWFRCSKCEGL